MIRVLRYSSLLNYSVGLVVACVAMLLLWPGLARNLFAVGNGTDFFMTHEHCYLGIGSLVLLHFISDLAIGLSYVAISLTLTYLVYRARRDIPFHWVFLAFGLFIVACGSTHFMETWTTFNAPVYWLAGFLKLVTAVASVATALVLPPLIPRTLALIREAKLSGVRSEELEQANRELETLYGKVKELDEQKTYFFANVSHELRTPLTSIGGFSQAMEDGTAASDPAETRALAAIIRGEAARMQRLVDQMLELSRLESGTVPLDPVQLRVDEFVTQIGRRYTRLGEAKGITVRYAAPSHVAFVADAGRLEQVLVNLLDNALQYTDAGGTVSLTASVREGMAEGAVAFAVTDTGRGIPAAEIPRLFERFYQVDRARSGGGRHVGLGLAIVREIVDAHGGAIHVESAEGEGTTVTVSVPLTPPGSGVARGEGHAGVEARMPERRPVIGGAGGR
jgi:signal transduction histidine kinase